MEQQEIALEQEESAVEQEVSTKVEETSPVEEISPELSPKDNLNALLASRTGEFDLRINYTDLKFLKNTLNQKVEWKGPNEAYLMIMAVLTVNNVLEGMSPKETDPLNIKLPASTIESINFFLNRVGGTGLDSAQRLFSLSMMFRQSMEAIKKLDDEINFIKNKIDIETEKSA